MANEVYANMMEVACKAAAGKSICAFPDVCFTPPQTPATPPGVPIPYPNTAFAADTTDGSRSVKISGKEVMLKNKSYFKKSTGDEAGCAPKKGLITSKITGKVYFTMWSMDVKVEGENVVRHLDMTTHNHASAPPNSLVTVYQDMLAALPPECANVKTEFETACANSTVQQNPNDKSKNIVGCSPQCEAAQKCVLVPKDQDKKFCCGSTSDDERTGDHLVEVNCFAETGGRSGLQIAQPKTKTSPAVSRTAVIDRLKQDNVEVDLKRGLSEFRPLDADFEDYDPEKAPCACVGKNHANANHRRLQGNRDRIKRQYMYDRHDEPLKAWGPDEMSYWTYEEARDAGARSHKQTFPQCDEECTKKQLDAYHTSPQGANIPPDTPVRTYAVTDD